jgi:hypothetical protein
VGIKIHNSLPPELKGIQNVKVFKNKKLFITKLFLFPPGVFFNNSDGR